MLEGKKYKKKPVVIVASPWFRLGDHLKVEAYVGRHAPDSTKTGRCNKCQDIYDNHGWVPTLEGGHIVCPGDFIITGVQGEHYPCKPDIFKETYEKVED